MQQSLPRNYYNKNGQLFFGELNLTELAEKYDTPLRVNAPQILKENHSFLVDIVKNQLAQNNIDASKFECGYAMKANQHQRLVSEAAKHADFLEASSQNDLRIAEIVLRNQKDKKIICHGFKTKDTGYFEKIIELSQKGYNIVPIIDSIEELNAFCDSDQELEVGVRITAPVSHKGQRISERFGITVEEFKQNLNKLTNSNNLKLTTLHMHVANTIKEINTRIVDFSELLSCYSFALSNGLEIKYINFGSGLPSRAFTGASFYSDYYQKLIEAIMQTHPEVDKFPAIQSECGRFLAEETQLLILKILTEKEYNSDFSWYILNGSAINLVPETHIDPTKKFQLLPTDGLSAKTPKTAAICGGITCDPEDYFDSEIVQLPTYNSFSNYVVIPNTGAYQESLQTSVRNQPGHCLIEGPIDVTLDKDGIDVIEVVPTNGILKALGYDE